MDSKPDPISKLQHFENEAAVVGHVVRDLPGAIWSGVADDFKANPVKKTVETVAAAAVGAALYIGARRAPIIARDVSAVGGTGVGAVKAVPLWNEAEKIIAGTKDLLADGWNATDEASRNKIGQDYASAIGKNVAPLAEVSVGAALGAASGHVLLSNRSADAWLTANLTEKAEYTWRRRALGTENYLLNKSGSFTGSQKFMNADGTANLLHVSEEIENGPRPLMNRALRSFDPQIEEGRIIDLEANRISAPRRGALHSFEFGFNPKNLTFHSHPDFVGARPSVSDVTRFGGVQMLKSGEDVAVYLGNTGKYKGVSKDLSIDQIFEQRGVPTLNALVVNHRTETARIIEGTAVHNANAASGAFENRWQWSPSIPRYVDYKASREVLAQAHVNDPEKFAEQLAGLKGAGAELQVNFLRELEDMRKLGGIGN